MSIISCDASHAFKNNYRFSRGNTSIVVDEYQTNLILHGHRIAVRDWKGVLTLCLCGWNTNTTKSRLNSLLQELDLPYKLANRKRKLTLIAPYKDIELQATDKIIISSPYSFKITRG